ncbi:MAG: LAGLIDADG family homing endonuclease [Bacilli bacterium]|nr:LAGLIDADG family homing endonuclease [Bacilli bacterium]
MTRTIFNNEQKEYMAANYLTMRYREIADYLGFTERQVKGWINNNCDRKIRTFNSDYFANITQPNQAYWLGFIYADGWVCNNSARSNYELGIELCKTDKQQLIDFNNELGGVHIIKEEHHEKIICDNPNLSITDSVIIRVYSKQIVQDLVRHNILENKTLKPDYPIVYDDLFFDFLRGYIDGDGCIYFCENKPSCSQVHITSAHCEVFEYIQNKVEEYGIKSYIYQECEHKYRLVFTYKNALKLLDLIYYDENAQKLDRKYQKYLLIKKGSLN